MVYYCYYDGRRKTIRDKYRSDFLENLIFCLNAVLPSFVIIAGGYLVRSINWIDDNCVKQMNKLCFHLFLPLVIFKTAYNSNFKEDFDPSALLLCCVLLVAMIFLARLIAPFFVKTRGQIGVFMQGAFRSNIVLLGIPFAVSLCGEQSAGTMAILVTFIVPVYNLLAVMIFSVYTDKEDIKTDFFSVLKSIVTNPLIFMAVVGILFSQFSLRLPSVLEKPLFDIANAGSTIAMMIVGAQLNFKNALKNIRISAACVALKLVLLPLLGVAAAVFLFDLRGPALVGVFLVLGTPCAAGSVSLADVMGADGPLAAEMVVLTTAASVVTIFFGSLALKTLGLI